jgi:acyl-CoA thioester hydrolase
METKIQAYLHTVQYYETDQMQVVHHSNYIRWFEEARIDYFDKIGLPYFKLEEDGFIAPVLSVSGRYLSMTRFGEDVYITVRLDSFNGIRFAFSYRVLDKKTGTVRAIGTTEHCFLDQKGKPINFKKNAGNYFALFSSFIGIETQIETES